MSSPYGSICFSYTLQILSKRHSVSVNYSSSSTESYAEGTYWYRTRHVYAPVLLNGTGTTTP